MAGLSVHMVNFPRSEDLPPCDCTYCKRTKVAHDIEHTYA